MAQIVFKRVEQTAVEIALMQAEAIRRWPGVIAAAGEGLVGYVGMLDSL